MSAKVIVIDCMNLAYRSWWPCRELQANGVHTGLEFGFIKNLLAITREFLPARPVLAWDGIPVRSLTINPQYKAGRDHSNTSHESPWEPRLEKLTKALCPVLETLYDPSLEADEQIARLVNERERLQLETLIMSNDADNHQLVSALTTIVTDMNAEPMGRPDIEAKWGVSSEKLPLLRAISGDKSDNLPGIPRIPEGIKTKMVMDANDIDHLLRLIDTVNYLSDTQRAKFRAGKDVIRNNYRIMNLRDQVESPIRMAQPTGDQSLIKTLCEELELNSLLTRKEWVLFQEVHAVV